MDYGEWDPMREDYDDPHFNSYIQGVGRDLCTKNGKGAKLFVDNFPVSLGKEGLLNLFSEFGHVLDATVKPSNRANKKLTFGFVTMDSVVAAEQAISFWNQRTLKSGVQLRVMPALSIEEKKRREESREMQAEFMSTIGGHARDDDMMSSVSAFSRQPDSYEQRSFAARQPGYLDRGEFTYGGRGFRRDLDEFRSGGRGLRPNVGEYGYGGRGFLTKLDVYDMPQRPGFVGRGRHRSFEEVSNRFSRGLNSDYAQPRAPGGGRGHFSPDRPRQGTRPGTGLGRGSLPDALEMSGPKRKPQTGNMKICQSCGSEGSTNRCAACKMHYCSRECQVKDWPRHRELCLDLSLHNIKLRQWDLSSSLTPDMNPPENDSSEDFSPTHGGNKFNHINRGVDHDVGGYSIQSGKNSSQDFRGNEFRNRGSATSAHSGNKFNQNDRGNDHDVGGYSNQSGKNSSQDFRGNECRNRGSAMSTRGGNKFNQNDRGDDHDVGGFSNQSGQNLSQDIRENEFRNRGSATHGGNKFNQNKGVDHDEGSYSNQSGNNEFRNRGGAMKAKDSNQSETKAKEFKGKYQERINGVGNKDAQKDKAKRGPRTYDNEGTRDQTEKEKRGPRAYLNANNKNNNANDGVKDGKKDQMAREKRGPKIFSKTNNNDRNNRFGEQDARGGQANEGDCVGRKKQGQGGWQQKKQTTPDSAGGTDQNSKRGESGEVSNMADESKSQSMMGATVAPDMDGSGDASNDLVGQTIDVGDTGKCVLSHYESPSKFWIILEEDCAEFFRVSHEFMKGMEKLTSHQIKNVRAGNLYCLIHEDFWTRVKIVTVNQDDSVTVFLPDTGMQENVKKSVLHVLDDAMRILPAQAICCCIGKVKPKGRYMWDERSKNLLGEWLAPPFDKLLSYTVVEKKGNSHALEISRDGENVTDILVSQGLAELVGAGVGANLPNLSNESKEDKPKTAGRSERFMAKDLKRQSSSLSEGESVKININDVHSVTRFMVRILNTQSEIGSRSITEIMGKLNLDDGKPYSPILGELVLAKFSHDGQWYRSEVTLVQGDQFLVLFVDYGNQGEVTSKDIRLIEDDNLLSIPAHAATFGLWGLSPDCDEDKAFKILADNLADYSNEEGKWSVVVKSRKGSSILVDFVSWVKDQPLSDLLNEKLSPTKASPEKASPEKPLVPKSKAGLSSMGDAKEDVPKVKAKINISADTLSSSENTEVTVSFVNSCSSFYVSSCAHSEGLACLMADINKKVKSVPALQNPMAGDLALAQYDDGMSCAWYRAKIQSVNQGKCSVFFMDFGNVEEVASSDLRQLPPWASNLPAQAIHCCLDIDSAKLSSFPDLNTTFKSIENVAASVKVLRKQAGDGGPFVVTVTLADGTDLLEALLVGTEQEASSEVNKSPGKSHDDTPVSVQKDKTVTEESNEPLLCLVCHIESVCEFYVFWKQEELMEIMQLLSEKAGDAPRLKECCKGAICMAQFIEDGNWYRAQISSIIDGESCNVQFIDFGNSQTTRTSELRQLPAAAKDVPAIALQCCFKGFETYLSQNPEELSAIKSSDEYCKMKEELPKYPVMLTVHRQAMIGGSSVAIASLEDGDGKNVLERHNILAFSPSVTSSPNPPSVPREAIPTSSPNPAPSVPREANFTLADIPVTRMTEASFQVVITNLENVFEFYCQRNDSNLHQVVALSAVLGSDLEGTNPGLCLNVAKDDVCACKFSDGTWYRCAVEAVRGDEVSIRYIDWGNGETRRTADLRPLLSKHLTCSVSLMKCKLHGIEIVDNSEAVMTTMQLYIEEFFNAKLKNMPLRVENLGFQDESYQISLFVPDNANGEVDIANDLVSIGMAKFVEKVSPAGAQEEEEDDEETQLLKKLEELRLKKSKKK